MKPALSRIVCAAASLADVSAGELASRTGLSASRVSQIRSGVRGDVADAQRLLTALQVRPEALIKHLGEMDGWGSRDAEETLAALLLCFDPEPPPLHTAPARIVCDRLSIIVAPTSAGRTIVDEFFVKAKPTSTDGHYKRAGYHRRIFIGDGVRWRGWKDIRLDFNPALLTPRATQLIAELLANCRGPRISRIDVAVDLPVQLGAVQALGTRSRKATAIVSDTIETIYIGDKNAAVSFAIYDKRNERRRHGVVTLDDLTRFEARLKKRELEPLELTQIENPFGSLQLLWLGGDDLPFIDRLLVRVARVTGLPLLVNEVPSKRLVRLRQHLADAAKKHHIPHPRDAFDDGWKREAARVLDLLGLT